MKSNLIIFIVITIIFIVLPSAVTCLAQYGYTNAMFLREVPDARGRSMGNGGSVYSTGAISAFYNPANLITSGFISGGFNYCNMMPATGNDYAYKNIYISRDFSPWGYYGINYSRVDYPDAEWTDEFGNSLGTSSAYDHTFGVWAAVSVDPDNSLGAGIKYINVKSYSGYYYFESREASSVAFDFGFLSRNHFPELTYRDEKTHYPILRKYFRERRDRGITMGISLANLGPEMENVYGDRNETGPIPRRFRLAAGYQIIDMDDIGLRVTLDGVKLLVDVNESFDKEWHKIGWSYGLEANFLYLLNLRFGRQLDRWREQRFNTVGFGLGPEWLRLDYSYVIEDDENWNPRGGEYSFSLFCNLTSDIFKREGTEQPSS